MKQVGGSIIPHDSSASALPPLLDKLLVLGLRQSFLNAVLSLLIQIPPQTFTCTPEVVSVAAPLFRARGGDKGHLSARGADCAMAFTACVHSAHSRSGVCVRLCSLADAQAPALPPYCSFQKAVVARATTGRPCFCMGTPRDTC